MDPVFRFKQFSIRHDHCIMKVGTDGVLLGAYAGVINSEKILDIGTGSGLIAIMLAQRSNAMVEGIEIDGPSARQAMQNAASCLWHDRIMITHTSFQGYYQHHRNEFDIVVCNPPFFPDHLKSKNENRNLARHSVSLNFSELAHGIRLVMKPAGACWLILPCSETGRFLETARNEGLFLIHELNIFPKEGKMPHRKIISLGSENIQPPTVASLIIRNSDDHYTGEYKKLTRSFYLAC
jgi:tRNA1Val (adenine37-N6)-methyltransferase